MTARLEGIPPGREGVRATLRAMAKMTLEGKKTLPVRLVALQLVEDLPQKDWVAEAEALHSFVRDRIRYVQDIQGVETLQQPERTLQLKQGDCDDKGILLASLLLSINHPARFHAVGFAPGKFSHVYVDTLLGGRWVALETTEPWPMGRAPDALEHMILTVK
jgi:transglutaminase-like putative cysteine protease